MILNLVQVENTVKTSLGTYQVIMPNGALPHARYPACKSPQYSVTMWNSGVSNPQDIIYINYSPQDGQSLARYALASQITLLVRRICPKSQRICRIMLKRQYPIESNRKISKFTNLTKPEPPAHVSKTQKITITGFLVSPRVYTYQELPNPSSNAPSNPNCLVS